MFKPYVDWGLFRAWTFTQRETDVEGATSYLNSSILDREILLEQKKTMIILKTQL